MAAPSKHAREIANQLQQDLSEMIPASVNFSRTIFALDSLHVEIEAAYLAEITKELKRLKEGALSA